MGDQEIPQAWLSARETKNWELLSELTERVAEEQPEQGSYSRKHLVARALWVLARVELAEGGGLPKRLLCGPLLEVFDVTAASDEELLEICSAAAQRLLQVVVPLESGLMARLQDVVRGKVRDAQETVVSQATGESPVVTEVPAPSDVRASTVLATDPSSAGSGWRLGGMLVLLVAGGVFFWLLVQGANKAAPELISWVRLFTGLAAEGDGFLLTATDKRGSEQSPAVAAAKKILKLSSLDDIYYELGQGKVKAGNGASAVGGNAGALPSSSLADATTGAKVKPTVNTDGPREPPLQKPSTDDQGQGSAQDDRLFGQRTPQPWHTPTPDRSMRDRQPRDQSGDAELFGERRKFFIEYDTSVRSRPSRMTGLIVAELRAGDTVEADARFGRWLRILSKRGGVAFIEERDAVPAR